MANDASRYGPPAATYRLQLHAGFGFDAVRQVLPYLQLLGVYHLYLSPIFAAAPGSLHGYDVFDHNQVNRELGGLAGLYALGEELAARNMGLILDFVPNHVGVEGGANPWWRDVLRYGMASPYASHFDIDWEGQPQMTSGVLVFPVLGKTFGAALEDGELQLTLRDGDIVLRYWENDYPIAPSTYQAITGIPPLGLSPELNDPASLPAFIEVLESLASADHDHAEHLLGRFRALLLEESALATFVQDAVGKLNGAPGDASSFDRLDDILARQHYRLTDWRVSADEINYRRFFDINSLAAIRVEREDVFEEVHRLLFQLVARGIVTGVRIDHIDGLYDPRAYLERLRRRLDESTPPEAPGRVAIYVEKILETGESLPQGWPVEGTTGYDFATRIDQFLVDPSAALSLTRAYERFTALPVRYRLTVYEAKRHVAITSFAGEINVLALQLHRIARRHRRHRDHTLRGLRTAITTVLACFPVYRTYIVEGASTRDDREHVFAAVTEARGRDATIPEPALDFLAEVLLLDGDDLDDDELARRIHFRRRFQQLSGPVMAKGLEDTTFYRYNRLLSLNEVGGDPSTFGLEPSALHEWFAARARQWPLAMSASSTHDTKRSEDARVRLDVLSEVPAQWRREVSAWARMNDRHRTTVRGERAPDGNTAYYLYQSLVAAWPPEGSTPEFRDRMKTHLEKAIREARVHTSWTSPDAAYEGAYLNFVDAILHPARSRAFIRRLDRFVRRIQPAATVNSLNALLLKCTAPGVPDFYQGAECMLLALTDPDNRRPVDFQSNETLPSPGGPPPPLDDPSFKPWLTRSLLQIRSRYSDLFAGGSYEPVPVSGSAAQHVFAFSRRAGSDVVVVIASRLVDRLLDDHLIPPEAWGDTALCLPGAGSWRNLLTGEPIESGPETLCADILLPLPFAVLASPESPA